MWSVMMVGMMRHTRPARPVPLRGDACPASGSRRGAGRAVVRPRLPQRLAGVQRLSPPPPVWALHEAALLSPSMATTSTPVAGVILIAAGAYQLTPFKTGCLAHCQSPLGISDEQLARRIERCVPDGDFRHGVVCVGCCWALMAVLFVVGVMNLAWVGVLTLVILAEKLGLIGPRLSRAGAHS